MSFPTVSMSYLEDRCKGCMQLNPVDIWKDFRLQRVWNTRSAGQRVTYQAIGASSTSVIEDGQNPELPDEKVTDLVLADLAFSCITLNREYGVLI